jgi:transposase-like protein
VKAHRLAITSDEIVRRGRRIRYRCPDCDAHGDLTVGPPAKAVELFDLLVEGHTRNVQEAP